MEADVERRDATADRRNERRQRVLKRGRIVFNGGYAVFDCTVRNLSSQGALLELASLLGVPNQFELITDQGARPRPCSVMWRAGTRMGVAFTDAEPKSGLPSALPKYG
jgi:hypothetical protein